MKILCKAAAIVIAGTVFALGANAAGGDQPSFDCDMAQTDIEKQICGSSALAALDRTVAQQYESLHSAIRSRALRNGMVQDQRDWLKDRNACAENVGLEGREACIGDAYRQRRLQLEFHRSVFLGPPVARPLRIDCEDSTTNQVEMRACLKEASNYVERTLEVASAAAAVEMRELDTVTAAHIGAEQAFAKSRETYRAYRDAACDAVGASYAGGSGTGIAILSCRRQADWERANRIASEFLFQSTD